MIVCGCTREGRTAFWRVTDCTEDGWRCSDCGERVPGEPPGYNAFLDKELIGTKVASILQDMHDFSLVYVSNSEQGEYIVATVAEECTRLDIYDQVTIVRLIAATIGSDYWAKIGQGIRAGQDPRNRCACGALSSISFGRDGGWVYSCSPCYDKTLANRPF